MNAEQLAREFARLLLEELGEEIMQEVVRLNRTPDYQGPVCASHNFCDANMVMAAAFEETFGREPALDGEDLRMWNEAWDIAHKAEFWLPIRKDHMTCRSTPPPNSP